MNADQLREYMEQQVKIVRIGWIRCDAGISLDDTVSMLRDSFEKQISKMLEEVKNE